MQQVDTAGTERGTRSALPVPQVSLAGPVAEASRAGLAQAGTEPHNRGVLDMRLAGYWSDKDLYLGDMEAADIAFRGDGTGWIYWSNAAGTFQILRFRWAAAAGQRLTLRLQEEVWGTWQLEEGAIVHRAGSQAARNYQIVLAYSIAPGRNVIGRPVMLLEFGQPVILGVAGNRFALEREMAATERDPVRTS